MAEVVTKTIHDTVTETITKTLEPSEHLLPTVTTTIGEPWTLTGKPKTFTEYREGGDHQPTAVVKVVYPPPPPPPPPMGHGPHPHLPPPPPGCHGPPPPPPPPGGHGPGFPHPPPPRGGHGNAFPHDHPPPPPGCHGPHFHHPPPPPPGGHHRHPFPPPPPFAAGVAAGFGIFLFVALFLHLARRMRRGRRARFERGVVLEGVDDMGSHVTFQAQSPLVVVQQDEYGRDYKAASHTLA